MKNELGDIPKVSLDDDEIHKDSVISNDEKVIEPFVEELKNEVVENKEINNDNIASNYYTKKDKANRLLTIVLVVSISIVVLIALGFGIKKIVNMIQLKNQAEEHKKQSEGIKIEEGPGSTDIDGDGNVIVVDSPDGENQTNAEKTYFKGFEVVGYIRIPKTGITYPILKVMTNKSLEVAVAMEYTMSGLNKPGNTTISGHNYKNEQFFAKNYLIQVGDSIFIKDMTGKELKYDVYDVKELSENDKSFVQRNTNGGIEITLSTCTDNVVNRIVIFAKYNP